LAKRDYYEILGIDKNATPAEIKKAYRRSALRHHPDRVEPGKKKEAEEKFKEISEAYEILSDANKKATYDQYGHEGLKGAFGRGGFGWQDFTHYGDFEDIFSGLGDLFRGFGVNGDIFGGGRTRSGRAGPRRGRDIEYDLEVEFTEAALGTEKMVEISRHDTCDTCKGSGAKPGTKDTVCPTCDGRGQISRASGFFSISQTCSGCGGAGRVIKTPCQKCSGRGKVRVSRKIKVKVPAGVDNGIRLRVTQEGDAGERGGPRGDLYVVIYVKEHRIFKRHNNDIYCDMKISFTQAVFGDEVSVPTVDGKVKMKIPGGTQSGKIFRLRGKGTYDLLSGSGKGDQLIRVNVDVPQRLTEEQKGLLKEFAGTLGEKKGPKSKGFFDKVKKFGK
jgi:molecular chaperone DnaJ